MGASVNGEHVPNGPRPTSAGINIVAANARSRLHDSAEYSPTSMPKMALNFAGGPPMTQQNLSQLESAQADHREEALPHDQHDDQLQAVSHPLQSSSEQPTAKAFNDFDGDNTEQETYAPDATTETPYYPTQTVFSSSPPHNGIFANTRLSNTPPSLPYNSLQPPIQQWRKSSSVYDGDDIHTNGLALTQANMPTSMHDISSATTPPLDNDTNTTTTEDRDRDEITVTTMTEPRTSVDTTIQVAESQLSDVDGQNIMNEKDDLMSGEGVVKDGRWDGTVPVVSEVYFPGKNFGVRKSVFGEHFD